MNIIETNQLSRRFRRTEAVHELTFAVPEGSICALLGPNGAGKTTTIKMLMNLLEPSSGAARVLGVDSRRLGERELAQIGYVSESLPLPLWMTVRQLLDYCRPFYPTWDRELEGRLLVQFDLPPERKLKQLSRGMLMKASLLSSLAYRPKLLLLDEPFSGLDPLVRDDFIKGLLEAVSSGESTALISSHDIAEVERLCDCVVMINAGRLYLNEPTDLLQARFRRVEVDLGDGIARLESLPANWLGLERAGGRISFIETRFDLGATESECRARFPEATVRAHPLTLREIFITLARNQSSEAAGRRVA